MLELSYRFQTLQDDFYLNLVLYRKRGNSIIFAEKFVRPFKTCYLSEFFFIILGLTQVLNIQLVMLYSLDQLLSGSFLNRLTSAGLGPVLSNTEK